MVTVDADPDRLAKLERFFRDLGQASDPISSLGWLYRRGPAQQLIADYLHGRTDLSHAVLDEIIRATAAKRSNAMEHLRHLLVASDVLPTRDEHLHRLQIATEQVLATSHPSYASVLRQWVTWRIIPEVRRRAVKGRTSPGSANSALERVRSARQFLGHLHRRRVALLSVSPAQVERWVMNTSSGRAQHVRQFLIWARRRGYAPAMSADWIPPRRPGEPSEYVDQTDLYAIASRCLTDDSITPSIRFAALLVLFYAQPLSRICALKSTDLHTDTQGQMTLSIGPVPLELPDRVADIARLASAAATADTQSTGIGSGFVSHVSWLYPGLPVTKHAESGALGNRLARFLPGTVRGLRNTVLLTLARELPPVVIADLLGVDASTADRWRRLAGASQAAYAAARLNN